MRLASFGFRCLPPTSGSAGADKFALELLPRLAKRGCKVTAYNRLYPGQKTQLATYEGVDLIYFKTVSKSGLDSLLHSLKVTVHILYYNTAEVVHIQGNNALFGLILRIFGKKIVYSIDGVEWEREKWPWFMRKLVYANAYLAVMSATFIAIDNVFTRDVFQKKFGREFEFIPFGSEIHPGQPTNILQRYGLTKDDYFLFVGRFIPDKGLQYLIPAFEKLASSKKLVLVGGAPNASEFESRLRRTIDPRIVFTGFVYGDDTTMLMKNAYAYIQPSDIEGLSPVMLSVLALGTPMICSDIQENTYLVGKDAYLFRRSEVHSLIEALERSIEKREEHQQLSARAKSRILQQYNWENISDQYLMLFMRSIAKN
jgi:glycosyltransferase involved in cell wall biosynthesis